MSENRLLKPRLVSDFWMIGDNPDLGELDGRKKKTAEPLKRQECVDHHVFKAADGWWHLWGCIRGTAVGRILYHWRSKSLASEHWEQRAEIIRADHHAQESVADWYDEEWIQSPFVAVEGGRYYMFYGGHTAELPPRRDWGTGHEYRRCNGQICLMTSPDGLNWTRRRDGAGRSRLFVGPGETRDPCVIRIGSTWHLYYAGYEYGHEGELPGIYLRTSGDMEVWSEPRLVHRDRSGRYGNSLWDTECPHVVERSGYYYLFRTENYAGQRTHVFRSADPADFGIGDASAHYVGLLAVAAPEIIVDENGAEYITSNHDLTGGTRMCRLVWEPAEDRV